MKALMNDWLKRRTGYWMYDAEDYHGDKIPWISFSLAFTVLEDRPLHYFATYDKNRWRYLLVDIRISRFHVNFDIPFKKLPDHVPSERQLKARGRNATTKI